MRKSTLVKQVFEVRYDRGYRYLDRCGEAMLILEEALPSETGKMWMPDEIAPSGARLKCPELDLTVAFDSYHLIVDHDPADVPTQLSGISEMLLAVISARFDLRSFVRFGHRKFVLFGTDSLEEARKLSVKTAPIHGWPLADANGLSPAAAEVTSSYENEEGSEGFRCSIEPTSRAEAPLQVDARLLQPSRLLPTGQREALIEQVRRRAQREKDPVAGLMLDIDYYWVRPRKADVSSFFASANKQIDAIAASIGKEN